MGLRPGAAEVQFQRARLLVGALVQAGVRQVVTSPGSRSTPLVLAALDLAASTGRTGGLELRSVLDERAAAFYALGQARATGMPSALICTSGSAPGHYLPAILEAKEAGLPLIVLTADRPVELLDCGAQQTTDQTKLFGSAVSDFAEIDLGGRTDRLSLRALRRTAVQAVFRSRWPQGGAVHLNVRARKPLERPEAGECGTVTAAVDELLAEPVDVGRPSVAPDADVLSRAVQLCRRSERGLIVAGPLTLPPPVAREAGADVFGLGELARRTGFPLLAEATSQSRFLEGSAAGVASCLADCLGAAWVANDGSALPVPDLILQVGAPPVSSGTQRLLETCGAPQVVVSDGTWTDPAGLGSVFLLGDVGTTVASLCSGLKSSSPAAAVEPWRREVLTLCGRFQETVANLVAESGPGDFHDGEVTRQTVAAMPSGALLMLGNSLPVRLVETWVGRLGRRLWVASQRGLGGIDGLVAGFLGSLSTGEFPAGVLVVGDVSLLHDLDGLTAATEYGDDSAAVIVVIDNGGGRIFERLPIASTEAFQGPEGRHWLTPHHVDFSGLARAFGLPRARVDTTQALQRELAAAMGRRGVSLVVARTVPGALAQGEEALSRTMASSPGP
ncbi:MAG: 2-succinyl-5-enolpyruvyl-6-hydroxy-3-cyclohexene-1-carboxylic-acid synthase [Acidobacteria bacterium]|nr:2-succinyl-5-enolpyruvyl-6-hydroxy-3-cyclohexene-1-carboxylic-acid synthase [Acidobacteriota bacterium]